MTLHFCHISPPNAKPNRKTEQKYTSTSIKPNKVFGSNSDFSEFSATKIPFFLFFTPVKNKKSQKPNKIFQLFLSRPCKTEHKM